MNVSTEDYRGTLLKHLQPFIFGKYISQLLNYIIQQ